MTKFSRQCLLIGLFSFLIELGLAVSVMAIVYQWWEILAVNIVALHYLRLGYWHWWVNYPTLWERFLLTTAAAAGALLSLPVLITTFWRT